MTGAGLREALQWALAAIEDNQRDRPWIFSWPWRRAAVDPVTGIGLGCEGQTKIVTSFAVPLVVSNTSDIQTTISDEPPLMNVAAASVLDDRALLVAFQNCVLPLVCWTHRQRLRVVWLYLRRYGLVGLELDCGRDVLMDQNISDIADSVVLSDVEPRDIEVATVLGPLLRDWLAYKTAIGHGVYFHVTLTRFWIHMIAVATLRQWRLHPNSDFGPVY